MKGFRQTTTRVRPREVITDVSPRTPRVQCLAILLCTHLTRKGREPRYVGHVFHHRTRNTSACEMLAIQLAQKLHPTALRYCTDLAMSRDVGSRVAWVQRRVVADAHAIARGQKLVGVTVAAEACIVDEAGLLATIEPFEPISA